MAAAAAYFYSPKEIGTLVSFSEASSWSLWELDLIQQGSVCLHAKIISQCLSKYHLYQSWCLV